MDEIVKTFHIDWKLLVAQIINFAIVLSVLWVFALKPLRKVMDKRSKDIEQSLKDAKEIERKLKETDETKEKIVLKAKKESQIILEKTTQEEEKLKEEKLLETKKEMEKLAEKAKANLKTEKEKMIRGAKQEVAGLIIETSSKIIQKNLDTQTNRELIKETIKQVKE